MKNELGNFEHKILDESNLGFRKVGRVDVVPVLKSNNNNNNNNNKLLMPCV